jgi:tetratricopeptide (TPR) repeat protein
VKKAVPILALAVLAIVQAAVYWNAHLLYRAKEAIADPSEKAMVLELAARVYPGNDRVYFELGRLYFERGAESLGAALVRDAAFNKSVRYFLKALSLNAGSAVTHVYLGQTLHYMSYLSLPIPIPYFEEYKKAASLTGHNGQVYYEVGKVLLARWESLRPEEKEFTLEIIKKTLAGKDQERLRDLLELWYLHGQDYAVIDRILPEDAGMARVYARFLGEKSLPLEAREKALSRAELFDFMSAKNELEQGQRGYEYFQSEETSARLSSCLRLLRSIVFYQTLAREELIDPGEYARVRKEAYLLLAKSRIEQARTLDDPDSAMETYLSLEDQPQAVGEFEKFLRERGLLGSDDAAAPRPQDLRALALQLGLDYKQNRYKDITIAGERLEKSAFIIPEAGRAFYARILGLVGDSYMKLDYLYEAEKYYLKALSAGPDNLEGLIRLERCYDRLSNDRKLAEIRRRLNALLTPPVTDLGRRLLQKGSPVRFDLVCDGQPLILTVTFEGLRPGSRPLLTALFNGRVVREEYAEGGTMSFSVRPNTGANSLDLETVNEPATLIRLGRSPELDKAVLR